MKTLSLVRGAALAALFASLAAPASAQQQPVYRGLDCSACGVNPGGYCVVNPFRFEYACAPVGTYACIGISGTSFCRYGTSCWDGFCR